MKKAITVFFILFLAGCATTADPRLLAEKPVDAVPPVASPVGGIYRLDGTGVTHVILLFPGGTILDKKGKEGTAGLLCSSIVTGGTKDIGPEEMDKLLDSLAIDISVSPQRDYTIVGMSFLPDVSDKAIRMLINIIKSPRLDTKRVELVRGIMKDGIIRKNDEAIEQAYTIYYRHYYRDDPRAERPTVKSVDAITRGGLLEIHKEIFGSKPLLGIIGNLDEKNTLLLKNEFPGRFSTSKLTYPPNPEYGSFTGQAKQKHCVILMIHKAPALKDASYAATVAADLIIGSGGFNSLLVKEVRTKAGLAYSADSFYQASQLWGAFGIIVITEPKELQNVKEAVARAFALVEKGITDEEVNWAKTTIINRAATEYNTPGGIVSHSMDYVFEDIPSDFDKKFLTDIAGLTLADVQKAAAPLIKGPWVEVTINPPAAGQENHPDGK
jgi:zinc protease